MKKLLLILLLTFSIQAQQLRTVKYTHTFAVGTDSVYNLVLPYAPEDITLSLYQLDTNAVVNDSLQVWAIFDGTTKLFPVCIEKSADSTFCNPFIFSYAGAGATFIGKVKPNGLMNLYFQMSNAAYDTGRSIFLSVIVRYLW